MAVSIRAQIVQYCNLLHEWNASYEEYAESAGLSYTSLSVLSAIYSSPRRTQKKHLTKTGMENATKIKRYTIKINSDF